MSKYQKRGIPCGTQRFNAKLTDDKVRDMRARREGGESWASLSRSFGVTTRRVQMICARLAWKHVA